jgi:hypothetical protein
MRPIVMVIRDDNPARSRTLTTRPHEVNLDRLYPTKTLTLYKSKVLL